MPRDMAGRVALVTGGASGIGRAAALEFAQAGAKVVVADLDHAGGGETEALIAERGGDSRFVPTDVTQSREVEALVGRVVEDYGRVDCAFNNAGIAGEIALLADYEEEMWDRVIGVNLKGVWLCMKYEIRQMLRQGGGAIVNTASVLGLVGGARSPVAYTASKHGVVGLTKTAALSYADAGIRINAVCPGYIKTPLLEPIFKLYPEREEHLVTLHPAGRLGTPEEVAKAVVWLSSDEASFVTGHSMTVDGGYVAQ